MADEDTHPSTLLPTRAKALDRWENEGGATCTGYGGKAALEDELSDAPALTNAELSQLHIRVIALEGLVIALLAGATERPTSLRDLDSPSIL